MQPCKTEHQLYSDPSPKRECSLVWGMHSVDWDDAVWQYWEIFKQRSPNIFGGFLFYDDNNHLIRKYDVAALYATFGINWAIFNSNVLSHWGWGFPNNKGEHGEMEYIELASFRNL